MKQHPLKAWRKAAGVTQRDLARLLDVNQSTVSRMEQGEVFSLAVMAAVPKATLGKVTLDEMARAAGFAA